MGQHKILMEGFNFGVFKKGSIYYRIGVNLRQVDTKRKLIKKKKMHFLNDILRNKRKSNS